MKKHVLSTAIGLVAALSASAQVMLSSFPPPHNYPYSFYEAVNSVAIDAQGNAFVAGSLTDFPQFDTDTAYSLIRKYDASENLLWEGRIVNSWGSPANPAVPYGTDVATDAAGNSFLIGTIKNDTVQLVGAPPIVFANHENKLLVAKYSPTGAVLWVRAFAAANGVVATAIETDAAGNLYLSASSTGPSIDLGNGITLAQAGTGSYNRFIAKISNTGTTLWALALNGSQVVMKANAAGEVFLSGTAPAQLNLGANTYTGISSRFFIAKLSTLGVPQWVKATTAPATAWRGLAPDGVGGAFVAGSYQNMLQLDGVTLPPNASAAGHPTFFLAKYTGSGQLEWVKTLAEITGETTIQVADLQANGGGSCLLSGSVSGPHPNLATGIGTNRDAYMANIDDNGFLNWQISGGTETHDDFLGAMALNAQNQVYVTAGIINWNLIWGTHSFAFGNNQTPLSASDAPIKVLKLFAGGTNRISGRVFYDYNSNGVKDASDAYATGQIVQTQPTSIYSASSNQSGLYKSFTESGTYTVALPSPPLYYTSVPASHSVTFAGTGASDTTRHFALQPQPNMPDLEITLTSNCPPRPGTGYYQYITYRNVGTTVLSGSVQLTYDGLWSYQSSIPAPASQAGNTLTWNFSNLQPNQTGTITAGGFIPTFAVLGNPFTSTAQVLPLAGDLTPANNTAVLAETIVNSYDPNDKHVSDSVLTPTEVSAAKPLEYTIRFQNTGTAPAINVKLTDTLDAQLNIPTLQVLSSSHAHTWSIRENGILEFRFDNIMLPDSNTNEAASHGFVKYRIKPKTNLALGSIIRNTAAIYFDFNAPVITNTTTTEVALVSAVADLNNPQLQVYPNPSKGLFTVQLQNVPEQTVNAELRNVLGQIVWQQNLAAENGHVQQQIKTNNLRKGVYLLQISTANGFAVQKVVIE